MREHRGADRLTEAAVGDGFTAAADVNRSAGHAPALRLILATSARFPLALQALNRLPSPLSHRSRYRIRQRIGAVAEVNWCSIADGHIRRRVRRRSRHRGWRCSRPFARAVDNPPPPASDRECSTTAVKIWPPARSGIQRLTIRMTSVVAETLIAVGNVCKPVTILEVVRDQLNIKPAGHSAGIKSRLTDRGIVRRLRVNIFERRIIFQLPGSLIGSLACPLPALSSF